MKRKLIKRNKNKNTILIKSHYLLKLINKNKKEFQIQKNINKYNQTYDIENAFRYNEAHARIMCPILVSSKVKKSRIKNFLYCYRTFSNIDKFNTELNITKTLNEIKIL